MSIFPFLSPDNRKTAGTALPMFREYAYDFENNCLLLRNGNTYLVEGNEALKIWIYHALITERFRYAAHSSAYGSEVDTLIGRSMSGGIIHSELRRFIVEALMVNPYIEELSNFRFTKTQSGVLVEFDCKTIYGAFPFQSDIKEVLT